MITISRKLNVINGYVSTPNGEAEDLTSVTASQVTSAIADSSKVKINGARLKNQSMIELPEFNASDGYTSDWFGTIKSL